MTHVSPCPKCGIKIIYQRELTEDEKNDKNCVHYPEILMHNCCPKCGVWLFSYPISLDRQMRNQQ